MSIKPTITRFLNFLLTTITKWKQKINAESKVLNPNGYEDLTPIANAQHSQYYCDALKWALQNDDVKNIAITGPYGSGKSSILRTFETGHPEYQYLKISLAAFQDEDTLNETDGDKPENPVPSTAKNLMEDRHRLVELSIIQQMFYRVNGKAIPDSRFNRIRKIGNGRMLYYESIVLATILGFTLLFLPNFFESFSWYNRLAPPYCDWPKYIGVLLFMPSVIQLTIFTARIFNSSKFNKINLIKGELEFDPKSETSILNKHLDEILYFFQATNFDVVLIEDLDRFNDPEIFTKLREINLLVNNADQITRKITFVYAIKDDMFKDKTRTKFFDFIIPIVPVINSSNSYQLLHNKIFKKGLNIDIKDNFLSNVTLYIDDMRALKNIYNEFMLYRATLKNIKLKDDQLFAMIVYKNIYPNDFAKLHRQEGVLYDVFNKADIAKKSLIDSKYLEIKIEETKLLNIQKSKHLTIAELRSAYLLEILREYPTALGLVINGQQKTLTAIKDSDQDFLWLTKQSDISYYYLNSPYNRNHNANTGKSFEEFEGKINPDYTYSERESNLQEFIANGTKRIDEKISLLKKDINNIKDLTVSELLNKYNSAIKDFDERFSKDKLLVYLVRNAFINENYSYLISYFYPGSLTINDANFALSVADRDNQDFNFELTKLSKLLERLRPEDFKEAVILNFQLIDYVAEHPVKYKIHLDNLIGQFSGEQQRAMQFYDSYIDRFISNAHFLEILFSKWTRLAEYIVKDSGFTKDRIIKHISFFSQFATPENLEKFNTNNTLSNFVSSTPEFTNYFKDSIGFTTAIKLIKTLDIKFLNIDAAGISNELFTHIYLNENYKLNREMIGIILKKAAHFEPSEDLIKKANLTTIRSSDAPELLKYVENNLSDYVDAMILMAPENTEESEETLLLLLNKATDVISHDQKLNLIIKQNSLIQNLTSVADKEIWADLLRENKLFVNWPNALSYYENFGLDDTLIAYFNQSAIYGILSEEIFTKSTKKSDQFYYKFSEQILTSSKIDDNGYLSLLKSNPYHYNGKLAIENLSQAKASGLIARRIIRLNKDMFDLVRANFPGKVAEFVELNISDYQNNVAEYPLELTEFNYLIGSPKISTVQKILLIGELDNDNLKNNPILAATVGNFYVTQPRLSLTTDFLFEAFKNVILSSKIILFEKYVSDLSNDEIGPFLTNIGEPYSRINIKGKQTKLLLTDLNNSIVKQLENKDYIRRKTKIEKDIIRVFNKLK